MKTHISKNARWDGILLFLFAAALAVVAMTGCSSAQKKFEKIVPGMSSSDVRKAMDGGPTRFENIPTTDYSAWYWSEDYCVLFKQDRVVAKDASKTSRKVYVAGGGYEEKRGPRCLAPGQTVETATSRTIKVPGVGTIELPGGSLRNPAGIGEDEVREIDPE